MTRFLLTSLLAGALAVTGCGGSDRADAPPAAVAVAPTAAAAAPPAPTVASPEPPVAASSRPAAEPPAQPVTQPPTAKDRRRAMRRVLRRRQAAARPARLAVPKGRPGMRPLTGVPNGGRQRRLTAPGGMTPVASSKRPPSAPVTEDGTGGMSAVTGAPGS